MQALIGEVDGFREWYSDRQALLKKNHLAQFFNPYRVGSIHIGDTPVRAGSMETDDDGQRIMRYYFLPSPDIQEVPDEDVLSSCQSYFAALLDLVYEAFDKFRYQLDDRYYYTEENFNRMRKSIEDAEEELGFPKDWTSVGSTFPECERWRALRHTQTVGCQLNSLFEFLVLLIWGNSFFQEIDPAEIERGNEVTHFLPHHHEWDAFLLKLFWKEIRFPFDHFLEEFGCFLLA
jgi:hypothetical protein